MKVIFDVECTPEEARKFLGLPDVAPMQETMMNELQERMRENMSTLDLDTMMKTWFPAGVQNWNDMQKMFWTKMGVTPPSMAKDESESEKKKSNK